MKPCNRVIGSLPLPPTLDLENAGGTLDSGRQCWNVPDAKRIIPITSTRRVLNGWVDALRPLDGVIYEVRRARASARPSSGLSSAAGL